jgi:fructose-1,6-bisphosphatase III
MHTISPDRLALLRALSARFPTAEAAISEAAGLRARLDLPKGVVHVISDVHGEDAKLRHVINNASGALRKLVGEVLGSRLSAEEQTRFLALLYYPREYINKHSKTIVAGAGGAGQRAEWAFRTLSLQFEIVQALRKTYRRSHYEALLPQEYKELFTEMASGQRPEYCRDMLEQLARHDRDWGAVRAAARLIRNLAVEEVLVAGDLGDRGPRIDRVIDTLMRQPRASMVWGNHDMIWMGAHLGHDPCMLTVLRYSARYRRAAQLEEGYGILTTPLERLVRECYADDPAERFIPKGDGHRDPLMVARMQKALAVMQFKAEGRMLERRKEWGLEHRRLLHRIDFKEGTVMIDGVEHAMLDTRLPTIDPRDPYAYSPEEKVCMDRIRQSFVQSQRLREHMTWVVRRGGMWTRRDEVLIFHACVPVNADGSLQRLKVDGREVAGREMMDALAKVVRRAMRKKWVGLDEDADWLWYLWCGPRSPLFGKDRIATFETYFVADKGTHKEQKNPYFELMHDAEFIRGIGRLFGCGDDVLVVNGHVPVKVEKGEQPIKRGRNAITIDGAFSEAYGDRGFTLVLRPEGIELAEHSAFSSVDDVIDSGADIVPKIMQVRRHERPRLVRDSEEGREVERMIADLEGLVEAYQEGVVQEG